MPPSPPLRHALITGSSRGIGLSIARLLSAHSYRCTLLSRSRPSLTSAVQTLESSHLPPHQQHAFIAGDISAPNFWTDDEFGAEWDELRARDLAIAHKLGVDAGDLAASNRKIDVLVNCAGVAQNSLFMRTRPGEIRNVVDMNLTAMMVGTRYLLRKQVIVGVKGAAAKGGERGEDAEVFKPAIVNVASLLGVKGGKGAVAYAASKAGVLGFTRALALEVGRSGIRVNAIVPGYISTDMTAGK
ncbi:NAD(P)-binding protein [Westerdykella ornata]|uniref:NAD(P)-binding protein n=1 Tax=Westerdykella ornata TaxID=318751 RepID=A0A6A6JUP0_WESOR|nr:NAD(P)-binding protein [Westerdykella ornata]KAF2279466.1 NAD(P)-binding protein [Westerdykella ornata]